MSAQPSSPAGPLRDLRVVELAGEYTALAGRFFADLGADVVVVEPPGGATARHLPPFVDDEPPSASGVRCTPVDENLSAPVAFDLQKRVPTTDDTVNFGRRRKASQNRWKAVGAATVVLLAAAAGVGLALFGR